MGMAGQTNKPTNTTWQEPQELLQLQPEFFLNLLGKFEDPVFVKNNRHQWIFTNEAFEMLVGCSDLIGKTDADLLPADQVDKFYEGDDHVIDTQTSLIQEEEIGEGCYALVKKMPITLPDNSPGLIGIIFDISDYRKVQLEVEKLRIAKVQSRTDPLTGLANRRHLDEHFSQLLESNQIRNQSLGLLHIDLDYFKEINDTKGHLLGDAVLTNLAGILRDCVRSQDFIARIGGDEFVIVITDQSQEELEAVAQRVINATDKTLEIDGDECTLSVSVGVASDESGQLTLNQMLKFADLALYRAKHNGRGRYEQFTSEIQKEHDELRHRKEEFKNALNNNQIFPVYQPQFCTETLEVTGVEALARWNHPVRGVLPPSEFLEIAISERRLVDLDRIILHAAMQDAKELMRSGLGMPALSINVSPQSLATRDFVEVIKNLKPFPNRICFELVETMLLDEPNGVVSDNLDGLRDLGVYLDIDDFGSGHASILGMLEAKPDRVKIDKRLVIPMIESEKHLGLVKSIIQISESLGMDTVAEGVESEHHRQLLKHLGCHVLQGFGFARPMPIDELKTLLQKQAAA